MNKGQTIDFTYLGYHEITNGMVHYMFHYIVDVKPYHTRYFIRCYMYRYSNSFQNCVR